MTSTMSTVPVLLLLLLGASVMERADARPMGRSLLTPCSLSSSFNIDFTNNAPQTECPGLCAALNALDSSLNLNCNVWSYFKADNPTISGGFTPSSSLLTVSGLGLSGSSDNQYTKVTAWTSSAAVQVMYVKAGNDGIAYFFGAAGCDSFAALPDLVTPTAQNGNLRGISHVTFCRFAPPDVTFNPNPQVSITKTTCAAASATNLVQNQPVTWEYTVTNTGNVPLTAVSLEDDPAGTVDTSSATTLAPGAVATYTKTGSAIDLTYTNDVIVTANYNGQPTYNGSAISATASSSYTAVTPSISIVKKINNVDNPEVLVGADVTVTIAVTNSGTVDLTEVAVTDAVDGGAAVAVGVTPTKEGGDDDDVLEAGETWTYRLPATAAVAGTHTDTATVNAKAPYTCGTASGSVPGITATDDNSYCAKPSCSALNIKSKGYWSCATLLPRSCSADTTCTGAKADTCGATSDELALCKQYVVKATPKSTALPPTGSLCQCAALSGPNNWLSQIAAMYLNVNCGGSPGSQLLDVDAISALGGGACSYLKTAAGSATTTTFNQIITNSSTYGFQSVANQQQVASCLGSGIINTIENYSTTVACPYISCAAE